jgi:hypothetical protein
MTCPSLGWKVVFIVATGESGNTVALVVGKVGIIVDAFVGDEVATNNVAGGKAVVTVGIGEGGIIVGFMDVEAVFNVGSGTRDAAFVSIATGDGGGVARMIVSGIPVEGATEGCSVGGGSVGGGVVGIEVDCNEVCKIVGCGVVGDGVGGTVATSVGDNVGGSDTGISVVEETVGIVVGKGSMKNGVGGIVSGCGCIGGSAVGKGVHGVQKIGAGVACTTLSLYFSHCAYMKANCPSVNSNMHGSLDRFIKL